MRNYNL